MPARVIDGFATAKNLREQCRQRVIALAEGGGPQPGLAVILLGDDPGSKFYIGNKFAACAEAGIATALHQLPLEASEADLLDLIERLNQDADVHGILVQLPLPEHIRQTAIFAAIAPHKDVDGFHPVNMAGLLTGAALFDPCTAAGIIKMLEIEGITIAGRHVVVVGAGLLVGKPLSLMLMDRGATVTVCTEHTPDLSAFTRGGDILVSGAGVPNLIGPDMVKPGAAVIDVGTNWLPDGTMVGDTQFEALKTVASHVTPVPGGVGPMTVTMLMHNTILAAERAPIRHGAGPEFAAS